MEDVELRTLARKHNRLRKHGTRFPFCCLCGEHHWVVRYELHHFGERHYDPRTIRLCKSCHDKVSDMQKDYPPIPTGVDRRLAKAITLVRGRIIIGRLSLEIDEELHATLSGEPLMATPPAPGVEARDHD